ncbi:hypothetical protein QCN29_36470 [Streptomyces sp. HNM0663]|uniref:Uncharacterized protein n=1 Tax=Streptomyces chengmaiensis TaxID=3040919 RepID=A0ABT6I176_9ACTN|nr:hypothetical protein [Streptomyces chengmaiensis]MDH2394129.1 hypothetical protein [Streptomyces chengmaiensis]
MPDLFRCGGFCVPSAGHDRNIPQFTAGETHRVSAWAVTLEMSAFVALVVGPLVLISDAWEAPTAAVAMVAALGAARRSRFVFRTLRTG